MQHYTSRLVPSLGLHIGPACMAGLSAGMRRERVSPQMRKKERKEQISEQFGTYRHTAEQKDQGANANIAIKSFL